MENKFWTISPEDEPTDQEVELAAWVEYANICLNFNISFAAWAAKDGMFGRQMVRDRLQIARGKPKDTVEYINVSDTYAELQMTVAEWIDGCETGIFTDYDGYAAPMRDNKTASFVVYPSCRHLIPRDATHMVVINR